MNADRKVAKMQPGVPEFVHYYGDWFWTDEHTAWLKSLLLFFDGIALALPNETVDGLIASHPVLAQPLAEAGLLRNYAPDLWLKSPYKKADIITVRGFLNALGKLQSPSDKELILLEAMSEVLMRSGLGVFVREAQFDEVIFDETMKEFDCRLSRVRPTAVAGHADEEAGC